MSTAPDLAEPGWRSFFKRTCAGSWRFSGRSTRAEVIAYGVTVMAAFMVISLIAGFVLEFDRSALLKDGLMLLALVPVPALFIRRLHDSGRSGTWAWLLAPAIVLWIARSAIAIRYGTDTRIMFDRAVWLVDWVAILSNMALLVLSVLPGTPGPNRFGADPRGRVVTSPQEALPPVADR